jgi:hypothetical protein
MKKVGYLSMLESDASAFYRTNGVLKYLNSLELSITNLYNPLNQYSWDMLVGLDTFIFQRPTHEPHIELIRLAKDMNIRVILDYDDDLLNVPFHNNASITLTEQKSNIKMAIHLADEVWVTTPATKHIYKPYNKNIHIIPNCHNDTVFPIEKKKPFNHKTKIMSYRGGASHEADMYQNINDIVEMINDNQDWTFRFQGSRFKHIEERTGKNHEFTDPVTLMQFFKEYHELNANIAFFPLLTNTFNVCKSNISLLEATYAGSAFIGCKNLPEFNHDFVIDLYDEDLLSFELVKDNFELLERRNNQAWDWILKERLLSKINQLRINRLLDV